MSDANKRNPTDGFSVQTMDERIKKMKKYGEEWRKLIQRKVVMTTVTQTWTRTSGVSETVKHICPWGIRETISKLYHLKVCKNFQSIPSKIKTTFPDHFTKDAYNPDEWTLSVSNSGAEDAKLYYHLYCQHCKEAPRGSTGKMGDDQQKNIDSLIANWDMLKLKDAYLDYTGCFLPWNPDVNASPNARKYIRDQSKHPKTSHHYIVSKVTKKHHLTQAKIA